MPLANGSRPATPAAQRRARLDATFGPPHKDLALALIATVDDDALYDGEDTAEGLAWLRSGVQISTDRTCVTSTQALEAHHLLLRPDGGVDLLDHPGLDPSTERFLGALGAEIPRCLTLAETITDPSTRTYVDIRDRETKIQALRAAVLWAQDPATDWALVGPVLRRGVTPAVLAEWTDDGWTARQATAFLGAGATREQARPWQHSEDSPKRLARLAALGQTPDDDGPWLAAGFTRSTATPWRVARYGSIDGGGFTPAQAYRLHRRGFSPTSWGDTHRYLAAVPRVGPNGTAHRYLTDDDVLAWVDAGMPADRITTSWWQVTQGDLDEALAWCRAGVSIEIYRGLRDLAEASPRAWAGIDAATTAAWRASLPPRQGTKVPVDPRLVAGWVPHAVGLSALRGLMSGITPEQYASATNHQSAPATDAAFSARLSAARVALTAGGANT